MRARADPCTSKDHNGGALVCSRPSHVRATTAAISRYRDSVLDELPSSEPGLEIVPVADVAPLAQLPAEIHLAATVLRAEVDESAVRILHLDAELRDVLEDGVDLPRDRVGGAAPVRDRTPLQLLEEGSHLGEQGL